MGFLGDDKWEVIVRYVENLQRVSDLGATITNLLNNFAIVITTKENIETMSNFPEIIYIEKPKRLYFEVFNSVQTSCITPIQSEMTLYGNNIYISFIDSGIDYKNPVFMDENGIGGCILMNDYIVKVDEGLEVLIEKEQERIMADVINQYISCRKKLGMTQADVAATLNTKRPNITRFENGSYKPTLDFLVKVAEGMGKKWRLGLLIRRI